jgi:hypothetical protein
MIDRFEELLNELSAELSASLHPDKIGACTLKVDDAFDVRLEMDAHQENLLIATFICDIPPGKFRENTLKDALKCNGPLPQNGTLAYSERNNKLALFSYLRLAELNGRKLAVFLSAFLDKATQWRVGIETGHTDNLVTPSSKPPSSMFGLQP